MKNRITKDTEGRLRFYAVEQVSPKQSITPEGFLVCHDVPIARTGTQLYLADEVPIEGGAGGQVQVHRREDQVFRPETMASFEGKPVTIDHPDDFVTPENWKELAVGITQNVRRGDGLNQDLLIADLLITDAEAIEKVRKGLRQVSCGYDADYVQEMPGQGHQENIVGNHVALVDRGRAGPRCAIQDKDSNMATKKKGSTWFDRFCKALSTRDADELKELVNEKTDDEDPEEDDKETKSKTGDRAVLDSILKEIKGLSKRVGDMETALEEAKSEDEEPDGKKKEDEGKTGDTVLNAEQAGKADTGTTYTGDAYREVVARAEILAPGFSIPTTDSARTADAVAKLQRRVLDQAVATDTGREVLAPLLAGRALDKLTGDALDALFTGAAELMKRHNNQAGVRINITTKDFGRVNTPAAINKAAQEFWANRK